jgi:hypothetical protein
MNPSLLLPLIFLVLAGCSAEPAWVLIEKKPAASTYVNANGLKKEGGLVRATLRTVAEGSGKTPQYSSFTTMLVNCSEKSVRFVSYEVVDDNRQASIVKHDMPNVFTPVGNWDASTPRRLCEHVNDGRPLA